jgi:phenylalanyl-tRNA synthetase beta chain
MQFPESWLREFCNPPLSTARAGRPADHVRHGGRRAAPRGAAVQPAWWWPRSSTAEPHPQADRLRVCRSTPAPHSGRPAADRLRRTQCARRHQACRWRMVGAELPPGADGKPFRDRHRQAARRGKPRHAVLGARTEASPRTMAACSSWRRRTRRGQDIRAPGSLDDTLFTLKLTPNLGHGLSVYGIAREVAALTGAPLITATHRPGGPGA